MNAHETAQDVLNSIFNADTGYENFNPDILDTSPSYDDLKEFAEALASASSEEDIQKFITAHPKILLGLFGEADDSILAVLTKPEIGIQYVADYAVISFGQGGCCIHLVELEPVNVPLFTKDGNRAQRHNGAFTQARNWMSWISANRDTFVKDIMRKIEMLPDPPERSSNGSFRRRTYREIESIWQGFGGFDEPFIDCSIVIGRWSQLNTESRRALIAQNKHDSALAKTVTYEQLARASFQRPLRNPW